MEHVAGEVVRQLLFDLVRLLEKLKSRSRVGLVGGGEKGHRLNALAEGRVVGEGRLFFLQQLLILLFTLLDLELLVAEVAEGGIHVDEALVLLQELGDVVVDGHFEQSAFRRDLGQGRGEDV